jgi:hypothetical protein
MLAVVPARFASACGASNIILDETFKTPESGWTQVKNKYISYGPSGATVNFLDKDSSYSILKLNYHFTSDGTDLCATAAWPDKGLKPDELALGFGIGFWGKDDSNYYTVMIRNDGSYYISRSIADNWQDLVTVTDAKSAINAGAGASNEVEVQISGSRATLLVNGKKITDFVGQPPANGSGAVGFNAETYGKVFPLALVISDFKIATFP